MVNDYYRIVLVYIFFIFFVNMIVENMVWSFSQTIPRTRNNRMMNMINL